MKNLIFLILLFLASCKSADHVMQSRNITVYSNGYEFYPPFGPASYVLYEESETYVLTLGERQIVGTWKSKVDTLFLYPKILYRKDGRNLNVEMIDTMKQPLTEYMVEQKYLIKGKEIIDISDYQKKIIDPEMDSYRLLSPDGYNRMDYRIMTSFKHFEPLKR